MARNPSSNRVEAEESTTGVEQGTVAGIDTPVETSTEQVAPASASSSSNGAQPAAGAAAASGDERFVFVNHPDTGAKTKRKDLILELWTQKKMSRSDIRKVLNEAGADMKHIVKFNTFYVFDGEGDELREYWERMTKVRLEFFEEPGPVGTAVRCTGLAYPDLLIEVEAIAYLPDAADS